jgi:energy-coupling factor transport system ATP-binding protein
MDDMALYANRLLVMNEGEIVMDGAPAEIFQSYKYLESIGLSAPQMTYTMHALAEKGYPVSTKAITVSEASEEIMKLWRHGRDDT